MHTTADDLARFMLALMHDGGSGGAQILQPETVELMRSSTSRFRRLFKDGGGDMQRSTQGLGHSSFRGGWHGIGGSAPGYQCLLRFHPERQIGFVIMTNVNAILGGGDNYASARREIYSVQHALLAVLDPTYRVRSRAAEIGVVAGLVVYSIAMVLWARWRRRRRRTWRE
jgi:CubicO group peptidase (beta-lactamase class C family)